MFHGSLDHVTILMPSALWQHMTSAENGGKQPVKLPRFRLFWLFDCSVRHALAAQFEQWRFRIN
jgi:hypothetical protein